MGFGSSSSEVFLLLVVITNVSQAHSMLHDVVKALS